MNWPMIWLAFFGVTVLMAYGVGYLAGYRDGCFDSVYGKGHADVASARAAHRKKKEDAP